MSRLLNQYGSFKPHSKPGLFVRASASSSFVPAWLRHVLYTDPLNRFEPARVSIRMLLAPAPVDPASAFDVETVTSSTESIIGRMYMNMPSDPRLSCTLTPSSVMLMEVVGRPLIVDPRKFRPLVWIPGRLTTKSSAVCEITGSC